MELLEPLQCCLVRNERLHLGERQQVAVKAIDEAGCLFTECSMQVSEGALVFGREGKKILATLKSMGHFLQGYLPICVDFRQVYLGILNRLLHHTDDLICVKKSMH